MIESKIDLINLSLRRAIDEVISYLRCQRFTEKQVNDLDEDVFEWNQSRFLKDSSSESSDMKYLSSEGFVISMMRRLVALRVIAILTCGIVL